MVDIPFDNQITVVGLVTFALAVLGAVLGIFNAWYSFNENRLKAKVIPKWAFISNSDQRMFAIEIVNLSKFPITITDMGFTLDSRTVNKGDRAAITSPTILDGGSFPRTLEPRTAFTGYVTLAELMPSSNKIVRAYAQTACLTTVYGSSGALKQLKKSFGDRS